MGIQKNNNVFWRVLLGIVLVGLIAIALWLWVVSYKALLETIRLNEYAAGKSSLNFRYYANGYKSLDIKLNETLQELKAVNLEFSGVREYLFEAQGVNGQLKENIVALERFKAAAIAKGDALETVIAVFKKKNKGIERDLQLLRKDLEVFQLDIKNLEEGRSKLNVFKKKIQGIKQNMQVIRRQAVEAKESARKERDRLELLYGNGGYLIKDGKNKSMTGFHPESVTIDVKFVN